MSTTGERIQQLRLRRGLTQSDLAEAIGETKQTIYKYEHGVVTNIPISKIEAIAKVLHCPPSVLTGWSEEEEALEKEQDAELSGMLEDLRSRDDMRMLFKLAKGAAPEDVRQAVAIIEALRKQKL